MSEDKKRLIIIQNDVAGTGKTTLARAMSRYLRLRGASHRQLLLSADESEAIEPQAWIDVGAPEALLSELSQDGPGIVLLEIATRCEEPFLRFFSRRELSDLLPELGVETAVAIPLTRNEESFESVVAAAETYNEHASYAIFVARPASFEDQGYDDPGHWDRSYAARVMDMFEAEEHFVLEAGRCLEDLLAASHAKLADTLLGEDPADAYGKDYERWLRRMDTEIHGARRHLFGEVARDFPPPAKARRGAR